MVSVTVVPGATVPLALKAQDDFGLKSVKLGTLFAARPVRVMEMAVRGMLPHNRLGRQMYRRLHVYGGAVQVAAEVEFLPSCIEG